MILTLPQRHPEQPQAEWLISIDTLVAPLKRLQVPMESASFEFHAVTLPPPPPPPRK